MALEISSVPVLTGEVARNFVDKCEYNSKYLASSQYSKEREDWVESILEKSRQKENENK